MNPLDQLKDIHLPQATSFWPPAWPWWLLLVVIIATITFSILHYKRQAWRRAALKQYGHIDWQSEQTAYRDANKLLKQICIQKIDKKCAHLSGEDWLIFLDAQLKHPVFLPELRPFAHILDEPNIQIDTQALQQAINRWIRKVKC
jgi:hypothetical protein